MKRQFSQDDEGALFLLLVSLGKNRQSDVTFLHSRDWAP